MKTMLTLVCLLSVCVFDCVSADVEMSLDRYERIFILEDIPDPELRSFQEVVSDTLENRLNRRFYNRYRFSRITQATIRYGDTDLAYDHLADQAQSTLEGSVTKALEEVFVRSPIYRRADEWLRVNARYVGEFVRNSISSVDEEDIHTLDTVQSEAETRWLSRLKNANDVRYGIHPSLHSPYLFVGSRVSYHKRTLFVVTARYHLKNFYEHKAETIVSIPIDKRLSVTTGFVYEMERPEDARVLARLNRRMEWGGSASIGTIINRNPRLVAEMTFPW